MCKGLKRAGRAGGGLQQGAGGWTGVRFCGPQAPAEAGGGREAGVQLGTASKEAPALCALLGAEGKKLCFEQILENFC